MIPGSANPLLLASAAQAGGYAIDRSLRFNSADSAYLSRTPASAGNRKTWTWAGWVKLSSETGIQNIFSNSNAANNLGFNFYRNSAGDFQIEDYGLAGGLKLRTAALFRDFSSWLHVTFAYDTPQATASDRAKLYINGTRVTAFQVGNEIYPTQNIDGLWNNAVLASIGNQGAVNANYLNGYLADIHFIDGQALDPTSFGEFDDNGIWQPKAYTGTYNTNGFHLTFSDNSTAGSLGDDSSGNGNNWTVNNISVAAGAGNDSMVDVPTNGSETDTGLGGEVRGNYATLNLLDRDSNIRLANGNLEVTSVLGAWRSVRATIGMSSGKWYWEVTPTNVYYNSHGIGRINQGSLDGYPGQTGSGSYGWVYTGNLVGGNSTGSASEYNGQTLGFAFDADAGRLDLYQGGVLQSGYFSGLPAGTYFPQIGVYGAIGLATANFGQRPFAYTAPSGFKALCTANLPAPVVTKPSEYMDVALYTGNGSTQTISGLEFSPDLVWIKNRAQADNHKLLDTVRGATEELESNTTDAEVTNADGLTAFNSDGFDLGADAEYNTNTEAYVAWNWDAGDSTVTNTDGSITSSVRANPSAGFSIVTFSTTSPSDETVGHGLGAVPSFIIYKARTVTGSSFYENWNTYHGSLPSSYLQLNTTSTGGMGSPGWGTISSSVFGVTNSFFITGNYVAYCFAPVNSYSAFGSYVGNGSATDGPFVYTGFRPRWVLIKNTSQTADWVVVDAARLGYNGANSPLFPNRTLIEAPGDYMDLLSNGFKILSSLVEFNQNTSQYIYAAFAESPFQFSRAR